MRTLSSILSRSTGHEALLDLLKLEDEVKALSEKISDARPGLISGNDPDPDKLIPELGKAMLEPQQSL